MISLARRSGNIESIYAHPVFEQDEFEYEYGLDPQLRHKPAYGDRGAFIGAYGVAKFQDGGHHFEFMSKSDIEKRKNRSPASGSGPWQTDYEEMACKTVLRHMFKFLPISVELMRSVEHTDESVQTDIRPDMADNPNVIDIEGHDVNTETGEVQEPPADDDGGFGDADMPEEGGK